MRDLNQHLQDGILRLAISDSEFLRLVKGNLLPEHMTSRVADLFLSICYSYHDLTGEAPANHFHDELVRKLDGKPDEDGHEAATYAARLKALADPNKAYILSRVHRFVQARVREEAILKASDALAEGDLEQHDLLMYRALKAGIPEEDLGIDWFSERASIHENADDAILMPTGIRALDSMIHGYRRGWLLVTLGGYKAGKTWFLLDLCLTAAKAGLKCLYISHELSMRQALQRLDMMATGMAVGKSVGQKIGYYILSDPTKGLELRSRTPENLYDHPDRREKARATLARLGGGFRLQKYPMGQCSPGEVERYLEYLEAYEGYSPDVLVLDYLDIMDLSGLAQETRHQLDRGYKWAKGIADERNILVATVSQVQREALKRRWIHMHHVAEDARKVGNCDLMLAIGRDPELASKRIATINVVASREDTMNTGCMISTVPEIGKFAASSWTDKTLDEAVDAVVDDIRNTKTARARKNIAKASE